jgi:hypothetical protein
MVGESVTLTAVKKNRALYQFKVTLRGIHPPVWRRIQVREGATNVCANSSKHKAMCYGRMKEEEQRLKTEIAELLRRAQEIGETEEE